MAVDLSFLYGEEDGEEFEPKIKLPEGGGFVSSMTCRWNIGTMYSLYIPEETGIDLNELDIPSDAHNTISGAGTFWYWKPENYESGLAAQKASGARFKPSMVWRWEADLSTVKGWGGEQPPQEVFTNGLAFDVPVRGMGPSKDRHELHFVMLPSMVQALALAVGAIQEPVFDYEEFVREADKLSGERPDDTEGAHKWEQDWATFAKTWIGEDKDFEDAKLWQARTAIWEALGETDPGVYVIPAKGSENGKYDITSPNLKALVRPLYKDHTQLWATTGRFSNPHAAGVTKKGKRRQLYVVLKAYKSEEDAEASVVNAGAEDGGLKMPSAWVGTPSSDLVDFLKDYLTKGKLINKPEAVIRAGLSKNGFEEAASMTVDEAMAWITEHGLAKH